MNDFRKLTRIETYAPTDNVSELTARVNDEGWDTVFVEWLKCCHLTVKDLILVLSVGGGDLERKVSPNLVKALQYAQEIGTPIVGIVGRDGGYTARVANACVIIRPWTLAMLRRMPNRCNPCCCICLSLTLCSRQPRPSGRRCVNVACGIPGSGRGHQSHGGARWKTLSTGKGARLRDLTRG